MASGKETRRDRRGTNKLGRSAAVVQYDPFPSLHLYAPQVAARNGSHNPRLTVFLHLSWVDGKIPFRAWETP
jgi:hypothetical protein